MIYVDQMILLLIYHFKIFCAKYIVSFDNVQSPGLFSQNTKNHLQRVLRDENVLAVKFAEEAAG
jgi:hypothetical protein